MKREKCIECSSHDFIDVSFHDLIVKKCSKCDYIRIDGKEYDSLILNCIYEKNIFGIRAFLMLSDVPTKTLEKIAKFKRFFDLKSFKILDAQECKCDVCKSNLFLFKNRFKSRFRILYCDYCNSIYVNKKDFDEFLGSVEKHMTGGFWNSIKAFFKRIFKRSFTRRVKDNAKK